jgi:hypothetical protein
VVRAIQVMLRACEQEHLLLLTSCQQTCITYTTAVCIVKTPADGQRNCPKHVKFLSKNKFEKLVHLAGFIVRNLLRIFDGAVLEYIHV